ncbi:MAG: crossover junction endodeoxyribonuclease RuvC [Prevotellaceae bacterium]|jgi:crossover junction endodeoxyribonuclease RuvC|nr:crossover junction endodeoxyribonuclease RuvC [Prevotellaceae bacterium]
MEQRVILGIDPGSNQMGWAILSVEQKRLRPVEIGVLELSKIKDPFIRLERIFNEVCNLIVTYAPGELAVEAPFYGKNVQSMLKLGRAQGMAIAAALAHKIAVFEYAPRKVKLSITGRGAASKEQVANMLHKTIEMVMAPVKWDATDALAVAVCHYYQSQNPVKEKGVAKTWEAFLSQHPHRIKK